MDLTGEKTYQHALKEEKLFSEKIKKLSESTLSGSAATLINATITVLVLWPVANRNLLLSWFALLILISIIRVHLQRSYQKYETSLDLINQWKNYFLITITVSGTAWGLSAVFLFPSESIPHQAFLTFVLGGMVAGSVGVFSAMIRAFMAFSMPALLPLTLRFFILGDPVHFAMGMMLSLFWVIMFLTAKQLKDDILKSILLKYENIDLIDELENEVGTRITAEAELKEQKKEIENLINLRTAELQETNQKLSNEIEDRKRVTHKLKESEEKYRELVENINDVIFSLDKDGNITFVSPFVESISGFAPSEILGQPFSRFIYPEDLPLFMNRLKRILSGKSQEEEYRILTKSGGYCWVRDSSKIFRQGPHIIGVSGVLIDISERKNIEIERDRLEAQLKHAQKMESIGTLAGGIAHDFNNILYMIIGNAELAIEELPEWNPIHKKLESIKSAGLRASGIVKQLLDFSRNDSHEQNPMGAIAVIRDALKFLRSTLPSFITINQHFPEKEIFICGNPVQINQVLVNVLTNAAQAMEKTGGIIDFSVESISLSEALADKYVDLNQGEHLRISVADNGPGIDANHIERIFEPYYTTRPFGEGSGMGLAVAHGIIKNHNGMITVDSQPGHGTTFTIYFPVIEEAQKTRAKKKEALPHGNETILFVDDEVSISNMTKSLLERLGYQVAAFTDPVKALESFMLQPDRFDLVITDMTMPR